MSKLSRDDILKLARLSRLRLTEDEVKKYQSELTAILDYVDLLKSADTEGLLPTSQVTGLENIMRDDEIIEYQAKPEEILKRAPSKEKNQFKVKRVLN